MKKYITALMAIFCVFVASAGQKTTLLFNRPQFQLRRADASYDGKPALTVPLVYAGTLKLNEVYAEDCDEESYCFVRTAKTSYPMYMTMCQPCIDCYPCAQLAIQDGVQFIDGSLTGENAGPSAVTRWNLYFIDADKKAKTAKVYKLPVIQGNPVFFTGSSDKNGQAFAQYVEPEASFALAGKKNDYKFKYLNATLDSDFTWNANGDGTATAYIKSVSKWQGLCISWLSYADYGVNYSVFQGYHSAAVMDLTRNASLTKKMITLAFSSTVQTGNSGNWEDCSVETPASYCEELFTSGVGDEMDSYIYSTFSKKYTVEFIQGTLDDIIMDLVIE